MLKMQSRYLARPAIFILVLDQISKWYLMHTPKLKRVALMPHLNFHLAYNKGAAFGVLGSASGWQRWVFIAIALVISVMIFLWSKKLGKKDKWELIALGLILGGAWGNLLDRIRLGYVIDFIDFYVGTWHWYTFNIADVGICCGAAILILQSFNGSK